jgi:hypothetical protein
MSEPHCFKLDLGLKWDQTAYAPIWRTEDGKVRVHTPAILVPPRDGAWTSRSLRRRRGDAIALAILRFRARPREQWEENHFEHCGRGWPHASRDLCRWPPPRPLEPDEDALCLPDDVTEAD